MLHIHVRTSLLLALAMEPAMISQRQSISVYVMLVIMVQTVM